MSEMSFTAWLVGLTCVHTRYILTAHLACFQIKISTVVSVGSVCMQVHNRAFADVTVDYSSLHAAHPWDDQEWQAEDPQLVKQSARCEGGRHTQRCVSTFGLPRHQWQPHTLIRRPTIMRFAILALAGPCVSEVER